jgi:type I restriction enzyme S subunit
VTALDGLYISTTKESVTDAGLRNSSTKLMPPGAVLLTSRATIGFTAVAKVPICTNQGFVNFICGDDLLPEYLAYWLRTQKDKMLQHAGGTTFKEIARGTIRKFEISFPPLDEQRRIVDLLSRGEGIVRLRREAQAKAQAVIPALFIDMFGHPATNPKGWSARSFGSVGSLDRGRSRHRPRDAAELYGGPYPFIQTGDVASSGGYITTYTATYSEAGLQQSKLWPIGTLCITIAANIAKTGVLAFDACFPDSVVGFLPGHDVTTAYVQGWLGFLQPTLEASAPQAAQKNINLAILRALPMPIPPKPQQERFEELCLSVQSIVTQQTEALKKAEATFQALLARAFSGDLLFSERVLEEVA